MRLKDQDIRNAAIKIRPFVSDAIRTKGSLDDEDIRAGVIAARKAGEDVPNLTSERSLRMVEAAMVEM